MTKRTVLVSAYLSGLLCCLARLRCVQDPTEVRAKQYIQDILGEAEDVGHPLACVPLSAGTFGCMPKRL